MIRARRGLRAGGHDRDRGSAAERAASPTGVGLATVFFWALGVQLIAQGVAAPVGRLGVSGGAAGAVSRFAGAALVLGLGELLRRGVSWTRLVAAGVLLAIGVGGVAGAARLLTGHGSAGLVLSTVVMLTWAPWIAARLLRGEAARWFSTTAGTRRGGRVYGRWLWTLAAWSVVWGVLVAWSQSL
ncbi:MAG: hypothetical protein E6J14_13800 [Chloroflexi bacterium]|nr:MAG: hypothetical protein E6J14_13800 [Chloroflexota bacterium]